MTESESVTAGSKSFSTLSLAHVRSAVEITTLRDRSWLLVLNGDTKQESRFPTFSKSILRDSILGRTNKGPTMWIGHNNRLAGRIWISGPSSASRADGSEARLHPVMPVSPAGLLAMSVTDRTEANIEPGNIFPTAYAAVSICFHYRNSSVSCEVLKKSKSLHTFELGPLGRQPTLIFASNIFSIFCNENKDLLSGSIMAHLLGTNIAYLLYSISVRPTVPGVTNPQKKGG